MIIIMIKVLDSHLIFDQSSLHSGPGGVWVELLSGGRAKVTELDHTFSCQQHVLNLSNRRVWGRRG